jgi:hypothetical protein
MPKTTNTRSHRIADLKKHLDPDYITETTSIFKTLPPDVLEQQSVELIKHKLKLYIRSWVTDELEDLLKK